MQSRKFTILARLPRILHPHDPAKASRITELHYASSDEEVEMYLKQGYKKIGERRFYVCYHTDGHDEE